MLVYIVTTNNTSTRIRSVSRGESSMPCTEKARLVNRTKAALRLYQVDDAADAIEQFEY